jgi:hypothetical protein
MFIEMKVEFNATANYLSEKIADHSFLWMIIKII